MALHQVKTSAIIISIALALCFACGTAGVALPQKAFGAASEASSSLMADSSLAQTLKGSQVGTEAKKKKTVGVDYRAEIKGDGKLERVSNGATAGVIDDAKFLKRLVIWLNKGTYKGGVSYRAYNQGSGWSEWVSNGKNAGVRNKQMEAFQVRLTGKIANAYDIRYRAYVRDAGWQPWVCNGGVSGTIGNQVVAVQIRLQKKTKAKASVDEGVYCITSTNNAHFQLGERKGGLVRMGFSATQQAGKFYVRNELGGITLQSLSNGKYLTASGKKAKLKSWAGNKKQVWSLSWKGGLHLASLANGNELALSGKAVKLGKSGTGFSFTAAKLIDDGTYTVKNKAQGKLLTVKDASYAAGANVYVTDGSGSGSQAFTFTNLKGGWLKMTNAMTRKVVDVAGASAEQGTNIQQWDDNGTEAQQWKASVKRDGSLCFVNRASGRALSAAGEAMDGANVKSNKYVRGKKSQLWTLSPTSWESPTGDYELDCELSYILADYGSLWDCFYYVSSFSYRGGEKYGSQTLSDSTTIDMAKEMIYYGSGNCYRFAALFSWLARSLGYDTEVIAGYVPAAGGGAAPHGWVEVYLDGTTYVCDPDLNHEMGGGGRWYMQTYASAPIDYWW